MMHIDGKRYMSSRLFYTDCQDIMAGRAIIENVVRAISIKIVNLVMTADLKQGVELVKIGELPYISYDPAKYNGRVAYLTLPGMSGKVTIFQSGKLISVGTRSGARARRDLTLAVKYLASKQIIKPVSLEQKIRNIVAVVDLGESLDIEALYSHIGSIVYEPEVFPAAIFLKDGNGASAMGERYPI